MKFANFISDAAVWAVLFAVSAFAPPVVPAQTHGSQATGWQPLPGHVQAPIWPGTPPDAQLVPGRETVTVGTGKGVAGKPVIGVGNVSQPTMTVYSPTRKSTDVAVVVFPGGGFQELAIDLEGTEVCDWLNAEGITCVLLKYRVPSPPYHWRCDCRPNDLETPTMSLEDVQRTMGLVRLHAAEWHIDPHKIGVLGFSAGGYLVAAISTHFDRRLYAPIDAADKESCRPDFAVGVYPGHLWLEKRFGLNPYIHVTHDTPPTFLVQAEDDNVDGVDQSLVYYIALKKAGVPVEMHLYAHGGHAFGLRPTKLPITHWPDLVDTWLHTIGMLPQ
ncbi:MAG TPA: alpha/beta hydrolase [Candidatus Acidoferrales bacterium]|nr:alpha/beta hydrolase [Candidatus Acidoferrales bacterium]